MEIPKLTLLDNVEVFLNSNQGQTVYSVLDRFTSQQFFIDDETAQLVQRYQRLGQKQFLKEVTRPEFERLAQFTSNIRRSRMMSYLKRKRFNPLFFGVPIADISSLQKHIKPLADFLVRKWQIGFFICVSIIMLWLGSQNDWAIASYFNDVFSMRALLSFAIAAPLLKIFHEFGHILAATRFDVTVGRLSINFIGFYPLPNVDVSQADFKASREQRMIISLAGIYVDFVVAFFVLVLWYFSSGDFWKSFLGHIFAYNAIQSVVFNINPLIKLDGYYVFSDFINYRNLYSNANQVQKSFMKYVVSFGATGHKPKGRTQVLLLLYALASTLYRIRIILFVAWRVLPKYMGLGIFLTIWSAYIMFVAPLMARYSSSRSNIEKLGSDDKTVKSSRRLAFPLALFFVVGVILLLPMHFKTVQTGRLDYFGSLALTSRSNGTLQPFSNASLAKEGDILLILENDRIVDRLEIKAVEMDLVQAELYNVSGHDPSRTQFFASKAEKIQEQYATLEQQLSQLSVQAPENGVFLMNSQLQSGLVLEHGTFLGEFIPEKMEAEIVSPLPEKYVRFFEEEGKEVELRIRRKDGIEHLPVEKIELEPLVQLHQEDGERSYQLRIDVAQSPISLHGERIEVKITFHSAPIFSHLRFAFNGLIQNFRNSQIYWNKKDLDQQS